ncbi:unnamed protein product [Orchesella dallaii]|uniref:Ionotropic glutamate receptor C-terminal domain-containing protein n=1 Tax=Orchesella dallaii TaxID=48710 RepID=A0ABP1RTA5_9HEXA
MDPSIRALLIKPIFQTFMFIPFSWTISSVKVETLVFMSKIRVIVFNTNQFSVISLVSQLGHGFSEKIAWGYEEASRKENDAWKTGTITDLTNLPLQTSPNKIFRYWKLQNRLWEKTTTRNRYSGMSCDDLQFIKMRAAMPMTFLPEGCITELIYHRHNCSFDCFTFLRSQVQYARLHYTEISKYDASIFGIRMSGFRFSIFKPYQTRQIDLEALLKPISYFWWMILSLTAFSLAATLHASGVSNVSFVLYQIALESDFKISAKDFKTKHAVLLTGWLFACILLRNVYTSSIFSYVTAVSNPPTPESIDILLGNTTINLLFSNHIGILFAILQPDVPNWNYRFTDNYPYFKKRTNHSWACAVEDVRTTDNGSSYSFRGTYSKFLRNLGVSHEYSCLINERREKPKIIGQIKTPNEFALLYEPFGAHRTLISVFGYRSRFDGKETDRFIEAYGYRFWIRSIFTEYLNDDLATFEQSGIMLMLRRTYQLQRDLWQVKTEWKLAEMKTSTNLYNIVHYYRQSFLEVGSTKPEIVPVDAMEFESFMTAWALLLWLVVICVLCFITEILYVKIWKKWRQS